MKTFARFENQDGLETWIDPEGVICITEESDDECVVTFLGGHNDIVLGTLRDVVMKFSDATAGAIKVTG